MGEYLLDLTLIRQPIILRFIPLQLPRLAMAEDLRLQVAQLEERRHRLQRIERLRLLQDLTRVRYAGLRSHEITI